MDEIIETPERICLFFRNLNVFFSLKSELNNIGIKVTKYIDKNNNTSTLT
jgi:hypothetical protein